MTALLQAERISRSFGGRGWLARGRPIQAVTDVSLAVGRAEAVGLIGESGSGKSTIARLLLGLLPPDAGRVLLAGAPIAGPGTPARHGAARREMRRRMQMVFQDPYGSLDPRRTVGAQVADGLAIHGLAAPGQRAARVAALLDQVGLAPSYAARYPHEFSGGQRQRIGLARALSTGPDFLVADEPVSALDVSVQAQVLAVLADLRCRLGLALLFISHDLPVVRSLCDRVVVLYLGRVMEEGPAATVLADPRHPYTQALLSAAPRIAARTGSDGHGPRILLAGEPPSPAAPPSGCVFRTRCAQAVPACAAAVPPLQDVGPGHRAACIHLHEAASSSTKGI